MISRLNQALKSKGQLNESDRSAWPWHRMDCVNRPEPLRLGHIIDVAAKTPLPRHPLNADQMKNRASALIFPRFGLPARPGFCPRSFDRDLPRMAVSFAAAPRDHAGHQPDTDDPTGPEIFNSPLCRWQATLWRLHHLSDRLILIL